MTPALDFAPYFRLVDSLDPHVSMGTVTEMVGLLIESNGPAAAIGEFCEIQTSLGRTVRVQVIGFRNGRLLSMPLEESSGLQLGDKIVSRPVAALVKVGPDLMGRVLDGFGNPMDGGSPIEAHDLYNLFAIPPGPLEREHIVDPLVTGIRAIDGLLPCGKGQRVGLFGGSGVGKSTLLGSMCRNSEADVCVVALIGERNREVRAFLEHDLGPEGTRRSVVVVATSDMPALLRIRACFVALAVAEYFRDQGKNVLLVMDSVTRLAMAQREIGLAAGEPPSQKGYTPSVFNLLPRVFERAGNFRKGSITGFFTVLVEGDDFNEPIADAVRSILDGHIVLSRDLAARNHYPAIDILHSVSRTMPDVTSPEHRRRAGDVREWLATLRDSEDLISVGAYVPGSNPRIDGALARRDAVGRFLCQSADTADRLADALQALNAL